MIENLTLYFPLWGFVILMVGTPGPANLLAMTLGAKHGLIPVIPFLVGLTAGKLGLNLALAFGLANLLNLYPIVGQVLAWVSAAYMIFLALQGWNKSGNQDEKSVFGFWAGSIVHPLNPKAWVMATLAYSQFATTYETPFEQYLLLPISFMVAEIIFHPAWCLAGVFLQKKISQNLLLNRTLVVLTITVVIWALFQ